MRINNQTLGMTIIEILIAIFVLGIIISVILVLITGNLRINGKVYSRSEAVRATEISLESYRQRKDYEALVNLGSETLTRTVNGRNYTVKSVFCSASRPADIKEKMPCSSTAVFIDMTVSYNGESLNTASTYFTKFGRTDE